MSFAADVLKQNRQLVLVLRETVSSYTTACIIDNEKHETLRDALVHLSLNFILLMVRMRSSESIQHLALLL